MRAALRVLSLLLLASPAAAAQQDTQAWEQLNIVLPVASTTKLTVEQIARWSDRQGGLYTTEYGALLSHKVAKGVELGIGYRHVGFFNANTGADEERLRQQIVITSKRFAGRLRLDERFNPRGPEIGFRLRPLLRYNLPAGKPGVTLFASHESFLILNSTSWGQRAGYERMRNIVGVAFPVSRTIKADLGYLNQYRPARGGTRASMDHALNVAVTIDLANRPGAALHD